MKQDFNWFKNTYALALQGYIFEYSFFANGDLGDIERVEFEGNGKGGTVEFSSLGWLTIHLVDYNQGVELLNFLFGPIQEIEKEEAFERLQILLR